MASSIHVYIMGPCRRKAQLLGQVEIKMGLRPKTEQQAHNRHIKEGLLLIRLSTSL